jgi:hypothetical protein
LSSTESTSVVVGSPFLCRIAAFIFIVVVK